MVSWAPATGAVCAPVHLNTKVYRSERLAFTSPCHLLPTALPSTGFRGEDRGWGLLILREGNTEEALPGHSSPFTLSQERTCLYCQKDGVACVGDCLTYTPKNTTPWLSTSLKKEKKPCYTVKIFTFNEMMVPDSTLSTLLLLFH